MKSNRISVRLPLDLLEFLEAEAAKHAGSDRTKEIEKAIRQRQVSRLPKWQREKIWVAMKKATAERERELTEPDDVDPGDLTPELFDSAADNAE